MKGMEGASVLMQQSDRTKAVVHNPPALKTRMGFNRSSSSSNAIGQPCKGFSLVEAAIVLGVVGAVLGTIWGTSAHFYEEYKVNKTVEEIFSTARNIQNLISVNNSQALGSGYDLSPNLVAMGVYPNSWVFGTTVKPPVGGRVSIVNAVDATWGAFFNFNILNNIPPSVCTKIVLRASIIAAQSGNRGALVPRFNQQNTLASISTYTRLFATQLFWSNTFPLTPEQALTACPATVDIIRIGFGYTRIN